jgi:hypothetical protein
VLRPQSLVDADEKIDNALSELECLVSSENTARMSRPLTTQDVQRVIDDAFDVSVSDLKRLERDVYREDNERLWRTGWECDSYGRVSIPELAELEREISAWDMEDAKCLHRMLEKYDNLARNEFEDATNVSDTLTIPTAFDVAEQGGELERFMAADTNGVAVFRNLEDGDFFIRHLLGAAQPIAA